MIRTVLNLDNKISEKFETEQVMKQKQYHANRALRVWNDVDAVAHFVTNFAERKGMAFCIVKTTLFRRSTL